MVQGMNWTQPAPGSAMRHRSLTLICSMGLEPQVYLAKCNFVSLIVGRTQGEEAELTDWHHHGDLVLEFPLMVFGLSEWQVLVGNTSQNSKAFASLVFGMPAGRNGFGIFNRRRWDRGSAERERGRSCQSGGDNKPGVRGRLPPFAGYPGGSSHPAMPSRGRQCQGNGRGRR